MSNDAGRGQYEFDDQQSAIIADLSSGVRIVGLILFLLGALQAIGLGLIVYKTGWSQHFTGQGLLLAVAALVYLSFGWWFHKSSAAFDAVVTTQGRDIDNLMAALNELRKPFALIRTLILVYAVIIVIGLLAVLLTAFTHHPVAA